MHEPKSISQKTRKEIAEELSISVSTLKRLVDRENIDIPKSRYLKPSEYIPIFDLFGIQK